MCACLSVVHFVFFFLAVRPSLYQVPPIADKVQVLSSALEEDAGGLVLDRLLMEMAMREVQAKSNVDLHQEPRAVAKLRRECRRIKEILSANNQHVLSVRALLFFSFLFFLPCRVSSCHGAHGDGRRWRACTTGRTLA